MNIQSFIFVHDQDILWNKEITTSFQDPKGWWNGISVFLLKNRNYGF